MKEAILKAVSGQDLSEQEMEKVMNQIVSGHATRAQVGAFITALRLKGETEDEIVGAAKAIRSKTKKLRIRNGHLTLDRDEINIDEETILDTCGTGGEGTKTFSVSTATAFVVAGGGVKVAKYGHRPVSTRCGSADVLEALGVNLEINTASVEQCIQQLGIGFIYAPFFESPMRHAVSVRRDIGIKSIFNLLGPLVNPAAANVQVLGVYSADLTEKIARVLGRLGSREAFVVFGQSTLDEISICGPTIISHLTKGCVSTFEIEPEQFGLQRAQPESIRGGNAEQNARIIRNVLEGERGPRRDVVLLNAAAAFMAAGLDNDFNSGLERARESIDSGRARDKLQSVISFTQQCGHFSRWEALEQGSSL
ncbi:MAG: anthranilate phosphoribosyltransferase [Deltaproteobacteria bacterium]|nr:MAG: anthranilate phosphoribosyltransferase [Deltaproteobacteria bacterium]